jgi:hypothetical protein
MTHAKEIFVKLDRLMCQSLMKAALREQRLPGKYDVFAWRESHKVLSLTVAWKSFTRRSVALETTTFENGEDIQTNAEPLPNGIERNAALYVGSFRVDRPLDPGK